MEEFINTVDVIGDDALTDSFIDKSITQYKDNSISSIGSFAFHSCSQLTSVDFPAATSIGINAFYQCSALTSVDFPSATSTGANAFHSCTQLTSVNFPAATSIGSTAFQYCSNLTTADFPLATSIGNGAFQSCSKLTALILRSATMCKLNQTSAFNNMPIAFGTGYIYVPRALVDSYKAATNWSNFANQFRALEDYTVDGTTTGELDPTKI